MQRDYYTIKVNLWGGVVSPGVLQEILGAAWKAGVRDVRFGQRQQLILVAHHESVRELEAALQQTGCSFETQTDQYPNLISSYCGADVFGPTSWLTESVYQDLFEQIGPNRLKINISDNRQSFTPFFTGNLNFIASPTEQFWYLYVRFRRRNDIFRWPVLIYSNEIAQLSRRLEEAMIGEEALTGDALLEAAGDAWISQPIREELVLPKFMLPYYEGFNRYGNKTWLGIYRRDEYFSIRFLLDICRLCLRTKVGQICLTPWKSLIIKNIQESDREAWSHVLGRHAINVRHAANELCWQTEDDSDEGARLKKRILAVFERNDTRTFGLCFGIQTRPRSEVFGSVLVRKRPLFAIAGWAFLYRYDIWHTEEFNPNSRKYQLFESGLWKIHVAVQLERLCRRYSSLTWKEPEEPLVPEAPVASVRHVHECAECLTIYDPVFGDEANGIGPGVPFDVLEETYECPVCSSPKVAFREVESDLPADQGVWRKAEAFSIAK
ncbi:rubredoxin [Siphonobacter aquaeclarae]|uniref:Rubredoxin n=1 Tax=Siphonobacter aquaeclarae TaxID=563176 RepID=A0A1G9Q6Z3_9BACT|nr:rubredoxin [Siphonobacter aquaeclarae]SDM06814.1 Rubredoxin [Siphonobacter aquaeclarae]